MTTLGTTHTEARRGSRGPVPHTEQVTGSSALVSSGVPSSGVIQYAHISLDFLFEQGITNIEGSETNRNKGRPLRLCVPFKTTREVGGGGGASGLAFKSPFLLRVGKKATRPGLISVQQEPSWNTGLVPQHPVYEGGVASTAMFEPSIGGGGPYPQHLTPPLIHPRA